MLEPSDMEIIVDAVHQVVERVVGERMEQVYSVIEEMKNEMQGTVQVLSGNDNALLGEIRKMTGATPAEVLKVAGESWERFIRREAEEIGMTVIDPLGDYMVVHHADEPTITWPAPPKDGTQIHIKKVAPSKMVAKG